MELKVKKIFFKFTYKFWYIIYTITYFKVITPLILLNYAEFLDKNHYYEESFKIYEHGLTLFNWPGLYEIWIMYITKFIERYQGNKLERTRDMFEKVLD